MRTRRIIAIVVVVVALPFLVLGLIDPLEGGLAMLAALVLGFLAWLLSGVSVPRLAWISMLATILVGAGTLAIAMANLPSEPQPGPDVPVGSVGVVLVVLNWVWRVGVLVTLSGAVLYLVRLFRSLRASEGTR